MKSHDMTAIYFCSSMNFISLFLFSSIDNNFTQPSDLVAEPSNRICDAFRSFLSVHFAQSISLSTQASPVRVQLSAVFQLLGWCCGASRVHRRDSAVGSVSRRSWWWRNLPCLCVIGSEGLMREVNIVTWLKSSTQLTHLSNNSLFDFLTDPVSLAHFESQIDFRRNFVDILTARTWGTFVGDLQLIDGNDAVKCLLAKCGLKMLNGK